MKLASTPLADAAGAVLVHTLRAKGRVLKKGHVLAAGDLELLAAAGITEVMCARLDAGEVAEDPAAAAIAAALGDDHIAVDRARTGRANLRATAGGVLVIDRDAIARANLIDEAITIATLAGDAAVRATEMVATVKIIPFAVPANAVEAAASACRGAIKIQPWRPRRAGLVLTHFADTPPSILDRAVAAQRARLDRLDSELVRELRTSHDTAAVADAIAACAADGLDLILVLGSSAIMDRRDVVPAALERVGGTIIRFGMPVDPGNLLLLGTLGATPVIGVPGCARSLERSGFDWVLEHVCAGLPITAAQIGALGVGGLLVEGPRPSPRAARDETRPTIAAIVLAAGRASRMGENKLLAELDGEPLIRHTVYAALASRARPIIVVTGNEAEHVRGALAGLDVTFVHNPDFATGMASSLRAGVGAVDDAAGAVICLGDMPRVTADHINALIDAFAGERDDGAIIVPTYERKRGNPVLWGRRHFDEIRTLGGDVGARALIERHASLVRAIAIDDPGILVDVDTRDALASLQSE